MKTILATISIVLFLLCLSGCDSNDVKPERITYKYPDGSTTQLILYADMQYVNVDFISSGYVYDADKEGWSQYQGLSNAIAYREDNLRSEDGLYEVVLSNGMNYLFHYYPSGKVKVMEIRSNEYTYSYVYDENGDVIVKSEAMMITSNSFRMEYNDVQSNLHLKGVININDDNYSMNSIHLTNAHTGEMFTNYYIKYDTYE